MSRRTRIGVAALAGAVVVTVVALSSIVEATHSPANKTWISASTLELMTTQVGVGNEESQHVVLAQGRGKYNNPTDLRISVTSECALWTNTATTGDDDSESKARVELWVTIDGKTVPVSNLPGADPSKPDSNDPDDQAGTGKVVFCNRATRMKTEQIESVPVPECTDDPETPENECLVPDADTEDDIIIRSYNRSRSANAFNWGAMDIGRTYDDAVIENGKGIVLIEVHGRLSAEVIDGDVTDNDGVDSPAALAAVGKRTLFVEPVKMANDAAW